MGFRADSGHTTGLAGYLSSFVTLLSGLRLLSANGSSCKFDCIILESFTLSLSPSEDDSEFSVQRSCVVALDYWGWRGLRLFRNGFVAEDVVWRIEWFWGLGSGAKHHFWDSWSCLSELATLVANFLETGEPLSTISIVYKALLYYDLSSSAGDELSILELPPFFWCKVKVGKIGSLARK